MRQDSPAAPLTLRRGGAADVERIVELWTLGFSSGFGTSMPPGLDCRAYFRAAVEAQVAPFYYWVVEDAAGEVIAWMGLSPCRSNPISRASMAEASTYVDPRHMSSGLMTMFVPEVLAEIDAMDSLQHVVCFIVADNRPSLLLARQMGFEVIGALPASPNAPDAAPLYYLARPCGVRPAVRSKGGRIPTAVQSSKRRSRARGAGA